MAGQQERTIAPPLAGYLRKRRRAHLAAMICLVVLFLGYAYLTFLEAYLAPRLAASPERLFLLYESRAPGEEETSFRLQELAEGPEWSEVRRFQGEIRSAVAIGGQVWVFYRRSCAIYEGGRQVRAHALDLPWDLLAVVPCSEPASATAGFHAFGCRPDGVLQASRIRPQDGADGAALQCEVLRGTLSLSAPVTALAACGDGAATILGWPRDSRRAVPAPRADTAATTELPPGWSLESCRFDGAAFSPLPALPLEQTGALTLFTGATGPLVIAMPDEHKEEGRIRLLSHTLGAAGWQPPRTFHVTDDRWFGRRVLDLSACRRHDQVWLAIARASGLSTTHAPESALDGGTFPRLEPASPAGSFGRPEILGWLLTLAFLALMLVYLGVSLLTERFRGREPEPPDATGPALRQCQFPPASWLRRVLAFGIDLCVLFPVVVALLWCVGFDPGKLDRLDGGSLTLASVLSDLTVVCYAVVLEWRTGRTLGKRVLGTRVVCDDGRPIGLRQALVRNLIRPLDGVGLQCLLGLLFILSTERSQRLGDLMARTLVVWDGGREESDVPEAPRGKP